MRIMIASVFPREPGGSQTHMDLLKRALESKGHEVYLLQPVLPTRIIGTIRAATPTSGSRPALYSSRARLFEIAKYWAVPMVQAIAANLAARRFQPEILAPQDSLIALGLTYSSHRIPMVQTIHGPLYEHAAENNEASAFTLSSLRRRESESYRISSRIIAVDTGQANLAIEKGADPSRMIVIPNAVDSVELAEIASSSPEHVISRPYVVVSRRLTPKNGVEFAIRGFAEYLRRNPGRPVLRLVLVGGGRLQPGLTELVLSLGLGDRVHFVGAVDHNESIRLISGAVASIVPSVPISGVVEATSLTALETMALGVPLIASNIGGLAEIDGGTGCVHLVPPCDPAAIAERLERIMGEKEATQQVCSLARARLHAQFGADQWIEKILATYKAALEQ